VRRRGPGAGGRHRALLRAARGREARQVRASFSRVPIFKSRYLSRSFLGRAFQRISERTNCRMRQNSFDMSSEIRVLPITRF